MPRPPHWNINMTIQDKGSGVEMFCSVVIARQIFILVCHPLLSTHCFMLTIKFTSYCTTYVFQVVAALEYEYTFWAKPDNRTAVRQNLIDVSVEICIFINTF